MKAIRIVPNCDCGMINDAIFDSMLEAGFTPVQSRAGIDWVPFEQDQVKVITSLQAALSEFNTEDIAIIEQVEYMETYNLQDFTGILS